MQKDVIDHYEGLLADHYGWMFGMSALEKANEQRELLQRLEVTGGKLAIDLGSGSGFQSMALADLGFERVLALDTSAKLLRELQFNCGERHVQAVEDDMMNVPRHVAPGTADAVVCMGDTLTHLPTRGQVSELLVCVARVLRDGGRFVITYRDLTAELRGVDRFIPVRSTPDKIMTCFLEFTPDIVRVHDLIQVRDGTSWKLLKSAYPKLRLGVHDLRQELEVAGFQVYAQDTVRGLSILAAKRIRA